jgi:DNA-binding transcriptional LysR family regulator
MRIPDGQNFADIMAFVTVADCMSFAKAAQSLGVEPANLSRTVTRLEKRIGTRLLNRTTRSVSLTSAGIGYYQHCTEIVTCYRRAQDFITGQRADLAGPLRITVPMTFGIVKLGSVLPGFAAAYPQIQLEILSSDEFLDLTEHRIDAAIRMEVSRDPLLNSRLLGQTDRILCASPAYLAEYGVPATPAELTSHRCIVFSRNPQTNTWNLRSSNRRPARVTVNSFCSVNNSLLLKQFAINGTGITPVAEYVVSDELSSGELVRVLPEWTLGTINISIVYLSPRNLSPRVRAFIDYFSENLRLNHDKSAA